MLSTHLFVNFYQGDMNKYRIILDRTPITAMIPSSLTWWTKWAYWCYIQFCSLKVTFRSINDSKSSSKSPTQHEWLLLKAMCIACKQLCLSKSLPQAPLCHWYKYVEGFVEILSSDFPDIQVFLTPWISCGSFLLSDGNISIKKKSLSHRAIHLFIGTSNDCL